MTWVKTLYLSVFLAFYRLGQGLWPARLNFDALRGVGGVSAIGIILALNMSGWLEVVLKKHLAYSQTSLGIFSIIFLAINYHILVIRGAGVRFEHESSYMPRGKRILIYVIGASVVLATAVFSYYSVAAYREAFLR
jgi:hypothetical protein